MEGEVISNSTDTPLVQLCVYRSLDLNSQLWVPSPPERPCGRVAADPGWLWADRGGNVAPCGWIQTLLMTTTGCWRKPEDRKQT